MTELGYQMRFNTPAFLGNADQSGQWRAPPIKALLRQWWRVAYAADHAGKPYVGAMRRAEENLFGGVAADKDGDSRRSRVRLRLNRWDVGSLTNWTTEDRQRVAHPEVKDRNTGNLAPVGPQLYLGYGPLGFKQGGTGLKSGAAIQSGEHAELRIAFPSDAEEARLRTALRLMHLYGTLGGRSRNGWGSFSLEPVGTTPAFEAVLDARLTLPWREALALDWPRAIGTDERGALIWQTTAGDWKAVMRQLAQIKIAFRTQFPFNTGKDAAVTEARHWLSYPVTNHSVRAWGNNARLPNSLRFKVRPDADGKVRGVIFHVPCLPPPSFNPDANAIRSVWQRVHGYLDGLKNDPNHPLERIPA